MTVQLTNRQLEVYVGGQLEIQSIPANPESYVYRGEIETITIGDENTLDVRFAWLARGDAFLSTSGVKALVPTKWVNESKLDYHLPLLTANAFPIGNNRIMIEAAVVWEKLVLYPRGGSRLDPSKVEGLRLPKTS